MDYSNFRHHVLSLVQDCKSRRPDAFVHLLYAPELSDELDLVSDGRRVSVPVNASRDIATWPEQNRPRLITLDCRQIGSYLFESDIAIDDPLLEASITRAHEDLFGKGADEISALNEQPGLVGSPVCGWIVSEENAAGIACRIISLVGTHRQTFDGPLHVYNPAVLSALWAAFSDAQKKNLTASSDWILCTPEGILHLERSTLTLPVSVGQGTPRVALDAEQLQLVANVPVVSQLLASWREMNAAHGATLPADARQTMHQHVRRGRRLHLDGDDLVVFSMVAVQLHPEAAFSPDFSDLVVDMRRRGIAMRDALHKLPESFWERFQPYSVR